MQIVLKNCSIYDNEKQVLNSIYWNTQSLSSWLLTGNNKKKFFAKALSGKSKIIPDDNGYYINTTKDSSFILSFTTIEEVLQNERNNDNSDYVEGGVDSGKTPRMLISELTGIKPDSTTTILSLFNLENILDRGLKYLSTGEIRKTLLCCALLLKPDLLILEDPFDGLDTIARDNLSRILKEYIIEKAIILVMDSDNGIQSFIQGIIEVDDNGKIWSGSISDYHLRKRITTEKRKPFNIQINDTQIEKTFLDSTIFIPKTTLLATTNLVEMINVTVSWSGRNVLENLSWKLTKGEHWLVKGPNGSGKTTFLELISGDNPQVFSNEVYLFGKKRGTGETIWEIKKNIGIVSWKIHTEFSYFSRMTVEQIILSGLHDSIGLYTSCNETEKELVNKWLELANLANKRLLLFCSLSYGEQRAVLVIRAAIKLPLVLILDEPCHGLDHDQQIIIRYLLEKIATYTISTILHVTHNPDEVLSCEKHILELCPDSKPMYKIIHC